ncbi:MAG: tRNA (guanosine(37)-N1)-methyltransferase TrmD [Bacilli bacterium]|nr:tRNA (guanosine(37)-N1)-methyltransferase TrmD [Bacilli bacterium]
MLRFDILTLFPEMIEGVVNSSILKRAREKGLLEINIIDFRLFSTNKHNTVDDYAYGGGAGMLISVEPLHKALVSIPGYEQATKILTTPSGKVFNQQMAIDLSKNEHIIIMCGHYEGIDNRILNYVDEEISIGDYVLTGGEIPALTIMDAVARLVKGVISDDSTVQESFMSGLLEYPQYTRPQVYDGHSVPEILLSGHHANIEKWKHKEALKKTYKMRPDLLDKVALTAEDYAYLKELEKNEN